MVDRNRLDVTVVGPRVRKLTNGFADEIGKLCEMPDHLTNVSAFEWHEIILCACANIMTAQLSGGMHNQEEFKKIHHKLSSFIIELGKELGFLRKLDG